MEGTLARWCGIATVAATLVIVVVAVSTDLRGLDQDAYFGGWGSPALVWAMSEGVLAVSGPIWMLSFVQRHLNGTGRLRRAMARSSYAAFMLQGPVLVALALALRPIDLPGDVKALVVATLGIVGSFALAWPLVRRMPLRRPCKHFEASHMPRPRSGLTRHRSEPWRTALSAST